MKGLLLTAPLFAEPAAMNQLILAEKEAHWINGQKHLASFRNIKIHEISQ